VAKTDLGTKRHCPNCGAKYYDLNKVPAICPKCGTPFEVTSTAKTRPAEAVEEPKEATVEEEAEAAGTEVISLEEADAEATGGSGGKESEDDDEEGEDLEVSDDDGDDTFLEEDDEDDDVTDIVGDVDDDDNT